jgi:hypothetical protein
VNDVNPFIVFVGTAGAAYLFVWMLNGITDRLTYGKRSRGLEPRQKRALSYDEVRRANETADLAAVNLAAAVINHEPVENLAPETQAALELYREKAEEAATVLQRFVNEDAAM